MSATDCLPMLPANKPARALPQYFNVRPSHVPSWIQGDIDLRVEDEQLLHNIATHGGMVDIHLLMDVLGWGHNKTYARLRYLQVAGYVTRHHMPKFHVAGETASALYMLTIKAGRLLAVVHGGNPAQYLLQRLKRNTSLMKADHAIELAHIQHCIHTSAKNAGCEVVRWLGDSQLHSMLHQVKAVTIPDSYFVLRLPSGRLMYFFIELDRNLVDVVGKWSRKCDGYLGMLAGAFTQRFHPDDDHKAFRLLTIAHTDSHAAKIAKLCSNRIPPSYHKLFLFASLPVVRSVNAFTSAIWLSLDRARIQALI